MQTNDAGVLISALIENPSELDEDIIDGLC